MEAWEEVGALLNPDTGLGCLPQFMKRLLWEEVRGRPKEWLTQYRVERLDFLGSTIEPLAADPEQGGHAEFLALCQRLSKADGPNEIAVILGFELIEEFGPGTWLEWASEAQASALSSLYCLASFWASPVLGDGLPTEWVASAMSLTAACLDFLDRPTLALKALEGWLNLSPRDYENPGTFASAIERSPLHSLDVQGIVTEVLVNLADLLRFEERHGPQHAVNVLEGWMGLSPADYLHRDTLGFVLGHSRLRQIPDQETCASLVRTLASALQVVEGRGNPHAVALLEAWVGLSLQDYESHAALASALQSGPLNAIEDLGSRVLLLTALADALLCVDGRSAPHAAMVLEVSLGFSLEDYVDRTKLTTALQHSPLQTVTKADTWANILVSLADALRFVENRGFRHAALVLEVWLGLGEEMYEIPEALRKTLADSPLSEGVSLVNQVNVLITLAEILKFIEARGTSHGGALLEAFLEISPTDYQDGETIAEALKRSPLGKIDHAGTWANVLVALAGALRHQDGRTNHAVTLLETWLGLEPTHYEDQATLATALKRSPLNRIPDSLTRINVIAELANSLSARGQDRPSATTLLEVWLGVPFSFFADAPCLEGISSIDRLHLVQAWLRSAGSHHPDAIATCRAVVDYFRSTRDTVMGSFLHRHEFFNRVRSIWSNVRSTVLARADLARQAQQHEEAEKLERQLLGWAEQYENRLLLERILRINGRLDSCGVRPPNWQANGPWPFRHVRPPVEPTFCLAESLTWRPQTAGLTVQEHSATPVLPLRLPYRFEQLKERDPQPRDELFRLASDPTDLEKLVPAGAVWLRSLFETDGTLRWWALWNSGAELELLASGKSSLPAAYERLVKALLAFDCAVQDVWDASQRPLSLGIGEKVAYWLQDLVYLVNHIQQAEFLLSEDAARLEFQTLVRWALAQLRELELSLGFDHSLLADHGEALLHYVLMGKDKRPPKPPVPWPVLGKALENPGPWFQEVTRRRQLNHLSSEYLQAVQQELDLAPLWQASQGRRIDWANTDVLFQVQGPLLAAPLAWLNFGGQPLFRRVASTSTIVSLTLRHLAEHEAEALAPPPRRLLSAHWLEAEDWKKMRGLAHLHAGLQVLAKQYHWEIWGLGDNPQASIAHLQGAFNRDEQPFGFAVLGGHGDLKSAGVRVADKQSVWQGQGNLSRLDWLLLVACAVGRLKQEGQRDIEGLCAQLFAHQGRCVLAARWPIADTEAATFIIEVVHQYLELMRREDWFSSFVRARALNRARHTLVGDGTDPFSVSFHLASAFEVYGLG